jgi:hypothetical protein
MVEFGREASLAKEPGVLLLVPGCHLGKLDRYLPLKMKVFSYIDLPLTAPAALAEDLVMRDYLPDQLLELLTG